MKKIGGHRTSVEMAVENRKIVPFDWRGCGSLVTGQRESVLSEDWRALQLDIQVRRARRVPIYPRLF